MYICFPNYAKMHLSTFAIYKLLFYACCTYFLLTCKKKDVLHCTALQSALDQLTLYPMLIKLS
jgi:hypothetical protein